jgi:hypothetical protein
MNTTTFKTSSGGSVWAPQLFKVAASVTFALGAAIHTGRMIMGIERWVREVFTPPVDIAFAVIILIAAIPGLLSWRRYSGGRAGRVGYAFAMLILVVSVPLHFRTLLTWSTDYLLVFPFWYSEIEVPMFLGLSYMVARLQFDGGPTVS